MRRRGGSAVRLPVRTTTLSRLHESGEIFDVVILVGVLEHIQDLDTALREVRDVLSPPGLVYVEVPDAWTFADWPNAPFQDFSTEHINFFSPVSLANLMGRHGFATRFSEQNAREQSYRTTMSNVSAVFQKQDAAPSTRPSIGKRKPACAATSIHAAQWRRGYTHESPSSRRVLGR